jgi:hypothetical protein
MLSECWIATLSSSKIVLCAHFECNVASHVDTTTSADGTDEISQESAKDVSEDQVNVTKGLSEAPNQSSEDNNTNISDSSPTSKGKPRTLTAIFATLQLYLFIYVYLCIYISRNYFETLVAYS